MNSQCACEFEEHSNIQNLIPHDVFKVGRIRATIDQPSHGCRHIIGD
jgi:hypothetical protein